MEKIVDERTATAIHGRQLLLFDNTIPCDRVGSSLHSDGEPVPDLQGDGSVQAGAAFLKAARERGCRSIQAVHVEFKPFRATLYSFRILSGVAQVKMHCAFQAAPFEVLYQAAHQMLNKRRGAKPFGDREAFDAFDAFVREMPVEAFNLPGARRSVQRAREEPGLFRSLQASFERVNVRYFGGQMPMPRLCWSPVRARRVVGTFHAKSDRVVMSRRLDAQRIPEFVLDFVMYHELLHKALGTGRHPDGRRRMHGPEFRRLERRFERYREAEDWLTKL